MLVTKQLPVAADFEIMKNKIDDDDARIRILGWTIPLRSRARWSDISTVIDMHCIYCFLIDMHTDIVSCN